MIEKEIQDVRKHKKLPDHPAAGTMLDRKKNLYTKNNRKLLLYELVRPVDERFKQ